MSDALNDIARDEQRQEFLNEYLFRVKKYILNPNQDTFKAVVKAAEMTDLVDNGYFGVRTNISENIENHLKGLISKDKTVKETEWAKLLSLAIHTYRFNELKAMSPFADKMIFLVDYGMGFVNIRGPEWLKDTIAKAIKNHGMKTYDCDDYLVIMPKIEIKTEEIKAIWLRCGISGVNGPRRPNER